MFQMEIYGPTIIYSLTVRHCQHVEKILKQKSLEIQLWETKLAQQAMQGAEDKQKELTEKRNVSPFSL